ncbi:MAG: hypothetical protein NTY19_27395 [Planctomycetota bacterium]|nr:hypothetical protein [Planctomycetota bacterium]
MAKTRREIEDSIRHYEGEVRNLQWRAGCENAGSISDFEPDLVRYQSKVAQLKEELRRLDGAPATVHPTSNIGGSGHTGSTSPATPQTATRRKNGSVPAAIVLALVLAGIFALMEWPWIVGAGIGAATGYWWRLVVKIVLVLALIAAAIAIAAAFLK